jgi:hypothetical protein
MADVDQRTGVVSPLVGSISSFGANRWAQTQHALLYGPTITRDQSWVKSNFKQLFGWRASEDEMTKIRSGSTIGQRMFLNRLSGSYGSWMNSPLAMSKWTTAAQLMSKPGAYTRQASRLGYSTGYIMENAEGRMSAGFFPSTQDRIRDFESAYTQIPREPMRNLELTADAKYARNWTANSLRFGYQHLEGNASLYKPVNRALNVTTGLMFDSTPPKIKSKLVYDKFMEDIGKLGYSEYKGSSKFIGKLNAIEAKGARIRLMGEASEFSLSATGAAFGGIAKVAGGVLTGYATALTAYQIADTAYTLGEAVFYKTPKRAYSDINRMLTRGMGPISPQGWITGPSASTNRARAVQAIQASKLNARAALGSEASLLSGHFG